MIETYIWGILAIGLTILMIVLLFLNAGTIYDFNKKLKDENPFLFKLIGSNEKYLEDKDAWIKHQRLYIIFFALMLICILLLIVFTI
jgi:hypothetical protein